MEEEDNNASIDTIKQEADVKEVNDQSFTGKADEEKCLKTNANQHTRINSSKDGTKEGSLASEDKSNGFNMMKVDINGDINKKKSMEIKVEEKKLFNSVEGEFKEV